MLHPILDPNNVCNLTGKLSEPDGGKAGTKVDLVAPATVVQNGLLCQARLWLLSTVVRRSVAFSWRPKADMGLPRVI